MKFDGISPAAAAAVAGRRRSRLCRDAIRDVERVIRKKGGGGGGGGGGRSCQRRPRRRVEASSAAIQSLFLACKSVFKGPGTVPSAADVQMLRHLLGTPPPLASHPNSLVLSVEFLAPFPFL